MDSRFIVSARKYRPQTFDTVVGQAHITTTLKNAIQQNQLAHAFLFCGPRGVGKTTCARILAKTINCENITPEGEACDTCTSCVSFNQGGSLNIHELDAASNNSVDDIRALVDQVRYAPQAGKYKVYIVDEVHMLSAAAFNAFLKTLEEPPPYAIFILATTEKHKIIPTILSRCQIFDFKRITTQDTVRHLQAICQKEDIKAESEALQLIAQKSEGCMRDSLSILDKIVSFTSGQVNYANTLEHLNILDEDYYFKLIGSMLAQDLSGALLLYDEINGKGFEGDQVLNGFAGFLRNLLVSRDEKVAGLLDTTESFRERYRATAQSIAPALLISALNVVNESEINYRTARNKRLQVELTLIKLCYLQQALQLTASPEEALVKKKLIETTGPVAFRQIQPIALKPKKEKPTPLAKQVTEAPAVGARLTLVEEPGLAPGMPGNLSTTSAADRPTQPPLPAVTTQEPVKVSSLEKIRRQYKGGSEKKETQAVTLELLQVAWNEFIHLLKEEKNSAAQSFDMAELKMLDENSFYVYTSSAIEYRFIDNCKNTASEFLQKKLNNTNLQIYIIRRENVNSSVEQGPKALTAVEQYQQMIEKYPLVKKLKERLKLTLER